MGTASEHLFLSKQAAPALIAAVKELCERTGISPADLEGRTLGEIFALAQATHTDNLPEYWRIWNDWNSGPEDPAPWGEL